MIFIGETELRGRDIRETLKFHKVDASEWFVRSGRVLAVHDLREPPWDKVCDPGTVESFDADEWALADDPVKQAEFAELLYSCLAVKVRVDLRYNRKGEAVHRQAERRLVLTLPRWREPAAGAQRLQGLLQEDRLVQDGLLPAFGLQGALHPSGRPLVPVGHADLPLHFRRLVPVSPRRRVPLERETP